MKKLKHIIFASITVMLAFTSCMSDPEVFDADAQLELDKATIRSYVTANYPNAIEHSPTGIWYELLEEGTPNSYTYHVNAQTNLVVFPNVTVHYKLRLLTSDQIVQETTQEEGVTLNLQELIMAWNYAFLPKEIGGRQIGFLEDGLQEGAKIRLFTPSAYAYGNRSNPGIPPNSPLFFEIEVLKIEE